MRLQIHLNQNLPNDLFVAMKRCITKCSSLPEVFLFSACEKHARDAVEESKTNSRVDFISARKLAEAFLAIQKDFATFPEDVKTGLKAAMYYFALDEDDEPDFASCCGFDDDIIVANVCLEFAGREDLKIKGRE